MIKLNKTQLGEEIIKCWKYDDPFDNGRIEDAENSKYNLPI